MGQRKLFLPVDWGVIELNKRDWFALDGNRYLNRIIDVYFDEFGYVTYCLWKCSSMSGIILIIKNRR